jgi:hypothetical protein
MSFKKRIRWYERDLGKYIHQRMKEENITRVDLDEDTINFFYQQFKTRSCSGHSEWSDRFQKNIWIKDEDNKS